MAELFTDQFDARIEANQVTTENVNAVSLWCRGVAVVEHDALNHDQTYPGINVPTPGGMKRAQENSWVIRNSKGEFYVIENVMFKQLFTPVK